MKRLSLIGLGIANERSVALKGFDRMRESDIIFGEFFTSILEPGSIERLEEMVGKKIAILDREALEEKESVIKAFR